RPIGVIVHRAYDHRSRVWKDLPRIEPGLLLFFEILHLARVATLQPLGVEVRLWRRSDGSNTNEMKSQRFCFGFDRRGIHERLKDSNSSTGSALRTRPRSIHPR